MSIATVVTGGYGSFGSIGAVVLDGYFTAGAEPEPETSVTSAGPHRVGTQYRAKTLSRERREEARKAAKTLRTKVVAALRQESWFALPQAAEAAMSFVKDEIRTEYLPRFQELGTDAEIMEAAIAYLIREARLRAEQDDDDLLLLASN